jgi:hypothetical protein
MSEHSEQAKFFAVLRRLPHPVSRWGFAVPNGFLDSKSKRIRAWKEGVVSGISDVFIPFPSKGHHGLFLEFKAPGGRVSLAQEEFLAYAHSTGYKAQVVYSYQEGLKALMEYLNEL